MDTREQLAKARELIQARRFDQARALLQQIDHPKATEWLVKLDEVAPQKRKAAKKKSSGGGMRSYLLVLLLIVVVLASVLVVLNQSSDDDEAATNQEAVSTPTDAPAPQPSEAAPAEGGEPTAPPEPAQSTVSFDDMQPNTVEINITGDYTASGTVENFTYIPEPTGLFAPRQIIIRADVESGDEPPGRLDIFLLVPDEAPGSYPLVDTMREMSDSWSVIQSIFGRESWISPDDMTAVDIEGSIEVVENGDIFTGSFEFTTSNAEGRSMTVSARINQVPFEAEG
jgi:hypothetical protein